MRNRRFQIAVVVIACCLMLLSPAFGQNSTPELTPQHIDKLITALKDTDSDVRSYAADALGKMGSTAASFVPVIITLLKSKDSDIRSSAAYALARMHSTAAPAVPALVVALTDKDSDVRYYAAYALLRIGSAAAPAASALATALSDKDKYVRGLAADALDQMVHCHCCAFHIVECSQRYSRFCTTTCSRQSRIHGIKC